MKDKTIILTMIFVLMFSSATAISFAEEQAAVASDESMTSYSSPDGNTAFGQNQYYSVVFDGEGDAIVAAKIKLQNTGKENLTKINIEIPGKGVRMINMMQEVQKTQKQCNNWNDICLEYNENQGCQRYERKCSSWYEQPSWPLSYYTVDRIEHNLSKSSAFDLTLPVALESQQTGTIIFYYKVSGYAGKSLGVYDFDFETMKLNQDVNQVRVSINVIDGLYMSGGQSNIDYRSDAGFTAMEKATIASGAGIQSDELSSFSNNIEYQQGYVKTAQGLDPLESFHVKGKYASSWLMLHKLGLLIGIIIGMGVISLLFWGVKHMIVSKNESAFVLVGVSAGSAILIVASWVVFGYVVENMNNWIGYQYGSLVSLLMILLAAIINLALIFGPSIYMGFQRGVKYGFIVFGITLVVTVFLAIVFVILLALMQGSSTPIYRTMLQTAGSMMG
ncbi:MAG: hypothetical protein NT001_01245 [Candidatus Woesearchaeota archaeon]|nr:hypothetical protein [Candidatus Woesearchaeota archaeon]